MKLDLTNLTTAQLREAVLQAHQKGLTKGIRQALGWATSPANIKQFSREKCEKALTFAGRDSDSTPVVKDQAPRNVVEPEDTELAKLRNTVLSAHKDGLTKGMKCYPSMVVRYSRNQCMKVLKQITNRQQHGLTDETVDLTTRAIRATTPSLPEAIFEAIKPMVEALVIQRVNAKLKKLSMIFAEMFDDEGIHENISHTPLGQAFLSLSLSNSSK